VALDDALIAQVQAADVIVIGAPMYNFGMTVQLKSWFDAIARAGVTFKLHRDRPGRPADRQKSLRDPGTRRHAQGWSERHPTAAPEDFLGFLGLTDVQFVYSEGLGMGPEAVAKAQAQADADINAVLV
jgi:FMN-dependent NADH-azoreductase